MVVRPTIKTKECSRRAARRGLVQRGREPISGALKSRFAKFSLTLSSNRSFSAIPPPDGLLPVNSPAGDAPERSLFRVGAPIRRAVHGAKLRAFTQVAGAHAGRVGTTGALVGEGIGAELGTDVHVEVAIDPGVSQALRAIGGLCGPIERAVGSLGRPIERAIASQSGDVIAACAVVPRVKAWIPDDDLRGGRLRGNRQRHRDAKGESQQLQSHDEPPEGQVNRFPHQTPRRREPLAGPHDVDHAI